MSTPNLGIIHIASAQSNKETTANEAFDILDKASTEQLVVDLTNDVSLSQLQAAPVYQIKLTGTQAALRTLDLPAKKHAYLISNTCTGGFGSRIRCGGGSTATVSNGHFLYVYCDGTNVIAVGAEAATVAAPGVGPVFQDHIIPSPGASDGSSTLAFTLPDAPNPPESLKFITNRLEQEYNVDYTIVGGTVVTFPTAPPAGRVWCSYRK